jgi:glycosyltransferase involved in cell wall biosynthesis
MSNNSLKKILVVEPETSINGVKTLLHDLYEESYWRKGGYEIKKIGIWFDLAYRDDKGELIEANSRQEKRELKRRAIEEIKGYKPDIIHLNAYCIDKEILKEMFSYPIVYTVHSVVPYDDLYFIEKYFQLEKEKISSLRRDISLTATLDKEEAAKILMEKYNIPLKEEVVKSLVIALYMTALQKEILKKANEIIYISPHVKEKIKEFYGIERGIIINNGTNLFENYEDKKDLINKSAREWKDENFPGKILVLYTGRVTEDKGVLDLVKAMESIRSDDVVLLISGSYDEEVENKIIESPYYRRKVFLITESNGINYNSLLALLTAADIVAYPSYHEPFGLVPIEAASLGKEVIVRDIDNLSNFIKEGIAIGFETIDELTQKIENEAEKIRKIKQVIYSNSCSIEDLKTLKDYFDEKERKMSYVRRFYSIKKVREEYKLIFDRI